MATKVYGFIALTGGGTGALDRAELDASILADKDTARGIVSGYKYEYELDINSGAVADGENVIAPPNATNQRWLLRSKTSGTTTSGDSKAASLSVVVSTNLSANAITDSTNLSTAQAAQAASSVADSKAVRFQGSLRC